jgi:hypothetical protein
MQLRRVLWVSAGLGFCVPVASYWVWWLANVLGVGNFLDNWMFHASGIWFFVFWDVLWVAIINVPLYMALAAAWRILFARTREMPLRGLLGIAAIVGFFVPLASYPLLFVRTPLWNFTQTVIEPLGADHLVGLGDVLTVATLNVPIYIALGVFFWSLLKLRREPTTV